MRVRFGPGAAADIARETSDLGLTRVLVIASPGHAASAAELAAPLGEGCVGVLAEARMHVPVEVAERGRAEAARLDADGLIAFGGGSAIGLAKAIALTSGLAGHRGAHDVRRVGDDLHLGAHRGWGQAHRDAIRRCCPQP